MSKHNRNSSGTLINGYWDVRKKIGEGGFGSIYEVRGRRGERAVVKVPRRKHDSTLDQEYRVYTAVQRHEAKAGIPRLHFFGTVRGTTVMVLQRLGKSLSDVMHEQGQLSIRRAVSVVIQLLDPLRVLHEAGFVHNDVSSANVMFGAGSDNRSVYLIDFGISQRVRKQKQCASHRNGFVGTVQFASVRAHKGRSLSARDDLEQVAYLLVNMVRGSLLWSHINLRSPTDEREAVLHLKRSYRDEKMWKMFPSSILDWFSYIRKLKYKDTPDYAWLKWKLRDMLQKSGWKEELPHM